MILMSPIPSHKPLQVEDLGRSEASERCEGPPRLAVRGPVAQVCVLWRLRMTLVTQPAMRWGFLQMAIHLGLCRGSGPAEL